MIKKIEILIILLVRYSPAMILNFRVSLIDSKIFVDADEVRKYRNVNINYDINIRNTTVVETETAFGKKNILRVAYAFSVNYLSPNIGHIRFEGSTDYFSPDRDPGKMKGEWDAGKAPVDVQNEIANNIIMNLTPLAMAISQRLGLPPSVPLPSVDFQKRPEQPQFTHYHG